METRILNIDGLEAIRVTLPNGTSEQQWETAFSAYILPAGKQSTDVDINEDRKEEE